MPQSVFGIFRKRIRWRLVSGVHKTATRTISLPLILVPMQREAIELMQGQTREKLLRIHSFSYIKSGDTEDMRQRKKLPPILSFLSKAAASAFRW